jgi:hypothetical protein
MDTKELLNKIAKLKNAIDSESDPDVKRAYQKKVDTLEKQIAEAEVKVEKVEAKAAAEEKKDLNEAEQKIQKLKAALASESDPDVKERYQKKIKQLEETLKDVKQEIKEEKKEIAEQKKDIKAATKEVKSAQKEVRKTAIKKVAAKQVERKQVVTRKAKRKTKIKSIISDLDRLINKNKELKSKYKDKGVDLKKDAGRSAKPFGYRFVGKHDYRVPTQMQIRKGLKRGTIDYEARPNRSDVYPKADAKLARGGMTKTKPTSDAEMKETMRQLLTRNKNSHSRAKGRIELYSDGSFKNWNSFFTEYEKRFGKQDADIVKKAKANYDSAVLVKMDDGGMMARGGRTKAEITADKRYKALKAGKRVSEDGNVYYESRANRSDVSRRDKLADGGMADGIDRHKVINQYSDEKLARIYSNMKDLDYSDVLIEIKGNSEERKDIVNEIFKELVRNKDRELEMVEKYYARGGRTKAEITADKRYKALKAGKRVSEDGNVYYESRANRSDVSRRDKLEDGGMMKKGGKVGSSKEDKARYAKPAGWRWKDEAVTKRVIERKQLSMQPSKKMRDKYPDLVYFEDRLNKADKKPTRSSADSI